jgi:hypothetical protein
VDVTTYQVLHHVDGSVVMEMEAAHVHAVPTAVSGDHGMLGLAQRLMRCNNTVYQIAHRCGPYNRLVRKDGQEKPPSPRDQTRYVESEARARLKNAPKKRVPRGGERVGMSKVDDEFLKL